MLQELQNTENKMLQKKEKTPRGPFSRVTVIILTHAESLAYYAAMFKRKKNKEARTMEHDRT